MSIFSISVDRKSGFVAVIIGMNQGDVVKRLLRLVVKGE